MSRDTDKRLTEVLREVQAHREWAAQQQLMARIHDDLISLPLEARAKIFAEFCIHCASEGGTASCTCWRDE